MKRPVAVTILAVLAAIAGILAVVDTLRYLGLLPIPFLGNLSFFGFSFFGALLSGVVALIWFSVMLQLWRLDPRGWNFVLIISILYLVLDVVAMIGGTPIQALWPSLLVSGLALILAILPGTKAAFGLP